MACGGGKNGSGSQPNLAVATSHTVKNTPIASSQGARDCNAGANRPSNAVTKMAAAITNDAIATSSVRAQSPRSGHSRDDAPNATQARLATIPKGFLASDAGNDTGPLAKAPPTSAVCGSAATSD